MASTVAVLPECLLPTTAITGTGRYGGIFLIFVGVGIYGVIGGSWVKFFLVY